MNKHKRLETPFYLYKYIIKQEMFVKQYAPMKLFCHRCFVQMDYSVQTKLHNCIKKELFWENVT